MARPRKLPVDEYMRRVTDAALHLVGEGGLANATMAKIADRAEVGYGSLYRAFSSRDDVLAAAVRLRTERVERVWEEALTVEDPLERVVALALAPLSGREDLDGLRVVLGYLQPGRPRLTSTSIEAQASSAADHGVALLRDAIVAAKGCGHFAAFDAEHLAITFLALLSQQFVIPVHDESVDWDAAAQHVERVVRHLAAAPNS